MKLYVSLWMNLNDLAHVIFVCFYRVYRGASALKPSLSLSMIDDPEGEEEDSLQSFRLTSKLD